MGPEFDWLVSPFDPDEVRLLDVASVVADPLLVEVEGPAPSHPVDERWDVRKVQTSELLDEQQTALEWIEGVVEEPAVAGDDVPVLEVRVARPQELSGACNPHQRLEGHVIEISICTGLRRDSTITSL